MAEAVARAYLARELGVAAAQLGEILRTESAGTVALSGIRPTRETRRVLQEQGLRSGSRATRLTPGMVGATTLAFGMTHHHVEAVTRLAPPGVRVATLRRDGGPIEDPYGRSLEFYQLTLNEIENAVTDRLSEMLALVRSDDDLLDDAGEFA